MDRGGTEGWARAQMSVLTQRLAPVRFRMSSSSLGIMGASHFSWKRSKDEGLGTGQLTFDFPLREG